MARLNDTTVKSLRANPGQDRKDVWFDEKGLGMRVSKTGRKSWVFVYHFSGRARRITFGTYPTIGVAEIRSLHATALQNLERNIDPGDPIQLQRAEIRSAPTIDDLAKEYLLRHAARKKSGKEDERMLNHDVLPFWRTLKAADISRRDVNALLDRIIERGAPIAANRVLALIRKMFNFGIQRSIITENPCANVVQPALSIQRDRILSLDEIRTFWLNIEGAAMSAPVISALKLELVTAQRKGEIVSAEWSEVDFETRIWTIPASKAKNGIAHRVYLTDLALELLAKLKALSGNSRYWLPSRIGDKPLTVRSISHALRINLESIGISNVTPHDLRRTAASMISSMGTPRLVVSKILNHVDSSVTAVYDRHGYDQEKKIALTSWANKLLEICNLIPRVSYEPARKEQKIAVKYSVNLATNTPVQWA
ncbi:Integrase [Collimonas arenae]|uniref:Integrase n=1 Tax=Collimonas arenae TaxID=279058 RepID=A0A0A1F5C1_9BURK|nr:site-specific integrase [Collimonas arenae]AIY39908.1 Integrase [Collimonas arenae]